MSHDDHKCSLAQLERALEVLDTKLKRLQLNAPVQIRAIGGFALMKYGIRAADRAFTVDIDSVTRDFAPEVMAAIHEVADELNLERDWINNDNVMDGGDPELVASMYQARWIADDTAYECIELQLASIPTLTRAKIIAADTAEFSGRAQDLPDLLELLRFQGVTTAARFDAAYPDPHEEYPAAREAVHGHFATHRAAA
ncbi:hypothetical protein ACFVVC_01910 [Pseudarthrobacter sp. NPDC058196]|uniref:hypothetical protein n=1 Tax=Pseudarthrobacter sp. NPDC058196 TaxID=3346376 RepID=UPI0036DEC2E6